MNTVIAAYFAWGLCFGWATQGCQYLFSEGPSRPADPGAGASLGSRVAWVGVCACLWPIMALTGLLSVIRLARHRRSAPLR